MKSRMARKLSQDIADGGLTVSNGGAVSVSEVVGNPCVFLISLVVFNLDETLTLVPVVKRRKAWSPGLLFPQGHSFHLCSV